MLTTYLPLVDYGVDLIALVDNQFRKIQVKTGKIKQDGGYWITFYKDALDKIKGPDAFFIIVLEEVLEEHADYLIVPSMDLSEHIDRGNIKVDKNDCCHLYFYKQGNSLTHWPTNNTSIDFSKYLNNWAILR